ncbi:hypothetical protein OPV22_030126 [Ensete ventricosum]|uniref:Uncharacterized protein n=1 Tax=Ensete ventricosum TaxID=4639 RepID=A0AAV8QFH3_ENSVE|nr:hypothetical protein OPV22_030126 [Ensete ventricosum]
MLQTTCQLASAWLLEKRQLGSICASLPSRHRHCLRRLRQLSSRIRHVPASIAVRIIRQLFFFNFSNYVKGDRTRAALFDLLGHDIFNANSHLWPLRRKAHR